MGSQSLARHPLSVYPSHQPPVISPQSPKGRLNRSVALVISSAVGIGACSVPGLWISVVVVSDEFDDSEDKSRSFEH